MSDPTKPYSKSGSFIQENEHGKYNVNKIYGVFAQHPASTPKYAVNQGARDGEFRETLARMYVSLANANPDTVAAYRQSLPPDKRVRALADILTGNGNPARSTGFIDFFLQQVQETYQEYLQIDTVLGDNYVAWYFGQTPPMFQYSGTLLNSLQDDQVTGFGLAYQHLIRGSQLAHRGTLLRLRYDNVIVSGSINSMSRVLNADNELACPFNFSLLVKEVVFLKLPKYTKMRMEDFVVLQTFFAKEGALGPIGTISDVRVRTTTILPAQLRDVSSVGAEDPTEPEDETIPAPQRLENAAEKSLQSPVTNNVETDPSTLQPAPGPESMVTTTPSGGLTAAEVAAAAPPPIGG